MAIIRKNLVDLQDEQTGASEMTHRKNLAWTPQRSLPVKMHPKVNPALLK